MELYIHRNGQKIGPYSPEEVRSSLAAGSVQLTDLAWHEGASEWVPLASIPGIAGSNEPVIPKQIIPPPPTPGVSGLAISSLVLGIASFFTVGLSAVPAIILGHIALSSIKKDPNRASGSGLAVAGLVIGYLGAVYLAFIVVVAILGTALLGFSLSRMADAPNDKNVETICLAHTREIVGACRRYATEHDGMFPESLTELVPNYLADRALLTCPMSKDDSAIGYKYFGGKATDRASKVLLISIGETADHRKTVVTYDGNGALQHEK